MNTRLALVALLAFAFNLHAADLQQVDRSIRREPAYRGKPAYCLFALGPRAEDRAWVVLDGDRLFVDRNGNGDLTDAGELVEAANGKGTDPEVGEYYFQGGDITVGGRRYRGLGVRVLPLAGEVEHDARVRAAVQKDPAARGFTIGLSVSRSDGNGWGSYVYHQIVLADANGALQFAGTPREAPVIHFGGPWQITLWERVKLMADCEYDIFLAIGTPGLGAGTTAFISYSPLVPEKLNPTIEIEYPSAKPGDPPLRVLHELKERC